MFDRTIKLIGQEAYEKIRNINVLVIGLGGVGGYAVEALIRSGVENITIADYDKIDVSNINRQIIATSSNVGNNKTEEWKKRILEINKEVKVKVINEKISEVNIDLLFQDNYDYIIDACDTLIVKKLLIKYCHVKGIKLITVCGMGKKLNPDLVTVCDLKDTAYDPLAKALRKYVRDERIEGKNICVSSKESPIECDSDVIASMMIVPSIAGIKAVSYIIDDIRK